jgi:hypothetical protein
MIPLLKAHPDSRILRIEIDLYPNRREFAREAVNPCLVSLRVKEEDGFSWGGRNSWDQLPF